MKVLFSAYPGMGHINPLLPLAVAFADAGHTVRFATGADSCPRVAAAGLHPVPTGLPLDECQRQVLARHPDLAQVRGPERATVLFRHLFAGFAAASRLDDLTTLAGGWPPDVVVHDPTEYAAPLVAEQLGVPSFLHSWGPHLPEELVAAGAEGAAELWSQRGLAPRADGGLFRSGYVDVCPPSMNDDRAAPAPRLALRPGPMDELPGDEIPAWFDESADPPQPPVVTVTLGSIFHEDIAALGAITEAVDRLGGTSLVAAGRAVATLPPMPASARIGAYLPLGRALGVSDALVTHGGASSVLTAALRGVPLVAIPLGADHHLNAEAAARAGFGVTVTRSELDAESLASTVQALLRDPCRRVAADAVRGEIQRMPDPAEAVHLVEELAAA